MRHGRTLPFRAGILIAAALLAGCAAATGESTEPMGPVPASPATEPAPPAEPAEPTPSTPEIPPGTTAQVDLGDRTFRLHVPQGYDPGAPVPLLVGLHGYTSNSSELDSYFGLTAAADERGFLLALPEGTTDPGGDQFWNALEGGCCDFHRTGVDDVGYVGSVIDLASASYAVEKVVVFGHSNGGFLAHQLACESADHLAAIASLAGPMVADASRCEPSRPVSVLHIHGDADTMVRYSGAHGSASATGTVDAWAAANGCDVTSEALPEIDLDAMIKGSETTVARFAGGCRDGAVVELWTIVGGEHSPTLSPTFTSAVLDFLLGG